MKKTVNKQAVLGRRLVNSAWFCRRRQIGDVAVVDRRSVLFVAWKKKWEVFKEFCWHQ